MPPAARLPLSGLLLLATMTVLWGGNWPAMRVAVAEVPPWTFRTLCLGVGGMGLLALARAGGHTLRVPRAERRALLLVTLFNIVIWHVLSAYALTRIYAGRAAIIGYTMPAWTVVLGWLVLGERLTAVRALGLGLGLGSLGLLLAQEIQALRSAPVGGLMMAGAAASWGLGTVLLKRATWTIPTVVLTAWQVSLGAVPVLAGALLLEGWPSGAAWSGRALVGTAYASLVAVIFCHYAWFRLLYLLPSSVAAMGTLGVPTVGVLSSAWVLGEPVGWRELAALGLVVVALCLVLLVPARRAPAG